MTFKNLQDNVMGRLNLTSAEARARVKIFLNQRYRKLQTSVGLGRVRFGTVTQNTAAGTYTYSPAGLVKPMTITYAGGNKVLDVWSMDQIRNVDPDSSQTGPPIVYVIQKFNATSCTIYVWPKPDAIYALTIDGIVSGTDMAADGDVPAFPEDFHDAIEFGATSDELKHMEKYDKSKDMNVEAEGRVRELRYFMAKNAYLTMSQGDDRSRWWWGPWWTSYRG